MILGPVFAGGNIETIEIEIEGDDAWLERFDYNLGEHGMKTYQKRVEMDGESLLLNNVRYADEGNDALAGMGVEKKREIFQNGYVSIYLGRRAE